GNGFEAELEASLSAADLLQHAPQLDWLAPHVRGRSPWRVGVAVPQAAAGARAAPARLELRSDLGGTALELPRPLDKPAAAALPTTIATALPLEQGEIRVDLGGRLALRARTTASGTGVRAMLGASSVAQ